MRTVLQKIGLIALILAGGIFIILMFTVTNWATVDAEGAFVSPFTNPIVLAFLIIIGVLYVGISIYLLWTTFSEDENMKKILLYRDGNSTANTSYTVAKKMIVRSAKQLGSVKIKKVKIKHIDNLLILTVAVTVKSNEIEKSIDTLRCMIADVFYTVLGVKFDTINFEVKKIINDYQPVVTDAENKAEQLKAQRVAKEKVENDIPEEEPQVENKAVEIAETVEQKAETVEQEHSQEDENEAEQIEEAETDKQDTELKTEAVEESADKPQEDAQLMEKAEVVADEKEEKQEVSNEQEDVTNKNGNQKK